jgi:hypothetical protein
MNTSSETVYQLNALIGDVLKFWMAIVGFDVEVYFSFESEDANPVRDKVVGYEIAYNYYRDFGDLVIGDDGSVKEQIDHELNDRVIVITAQIKIYLPKALHNIFSMHCSSVIFDSDLDYIGCVAVMKFDYLYQYSVMSDFRNAVKEVQLDAFTETTLRPNAGALVEGLIPYLPWFEYAASLANQMFNSDSRTILIEDMNLVLRYLSLGHELNFSKVTSLCDVTGSLVPVRTLILSRMPSLTP